MNEVWEGNNYHVRTQNTQIHLDSLMVFKKQVFQKGTLC